MVNIGRGNILKLYKSIKTDMRKNPQDYGTNLLGENLIIASYRQMGTDELKKCLYIISRIIKERAELERVRLNAGQLDNIIRDSDPHNRTGA